MLEKISKTKACTMSSSFADSFNQFGGDSPKAGENHSIGEDYLGPDSFSHFDSTAADPYAPIHIPVGEFPSDPVGFSSETYDNGPVLPPPAEMEPDEGYALREWRRLTLCWFVISSFIGQLMCVLIVSPFPVSCYVWVYLPFRVFRLNLKLFCRKLVSTKLHFLVVSGVSRQVKIMSFSKAE